MNALALGPLYVARGSPIGAGAGRVASDPAFKKWFGGSQVVDEGGNPRVMYHGTADVFSQFQKGRGSPKDTGWLGDGFYFWSDPRLASDYSLMKAGDNPNVMAVHLKLENPYYTTPAERAQLQQASQADPFASADFTNSLKDQGYDGVIHNHADRPGLQEVMVFEPDQVRSAVTAQ